MDVFHRAGRRSDGGDDRAGARARGVLCLWRSGRAGPRAAVLSDARRREGPDGCAQPVRRGGVAAG
eukprot:14146823-Heterocapsa_arctica.AAC.1